MMRFNGPKRLITTMAAVAMVALGVAPVSAQMMGGGGGGMSGADGGMGGGKGHRGSQEGQKTDAKPTPKVDEKAYNSALSGIPDRKFDPWKSTR
jgi:hypothetical protein